MDAQQPQSPDELFFGPTSVMSLMRIVCPAGRGKQDEPGKAMVREWVQFTRRPEVQGHVAFISDYDMLVAEQLVQGVDVWINTPRRPWEASGTSGMKVLVNGGLNLSELDGWWAEAYSPEVGWAIGDGNEHGDDPAWDAEEAEQLYTILEQEVALKTNDIRRYTGELERSEAKYRSLIETAEDMMRALLAFEFDKAALRNREHLSLLTKVFTVIGVVAVLGVFGVAIWRII